MQTGTFREIRINPIIPAESVLIATERGNKPERKIDPPQIDRRNHADDCPFCPGNEDQTPTEILKIPTEGQWQLRVVKNLYPVFGDESSPSDVNIGIHHVISGYGRHEVIIDHASHGILLGEMAVEHISDLFSLYRDRMTALYNTNDKHTYVLVFKNFGPASGGSIAHTHSQVIAMPVIPANVEMELANSLNYYRRHQECIFCALIDDSRHYEATVYDRLSGKQSRHIETGQYIIEKNDSYVAIKPFASRFPWEVHILPIIHSHDFQGITDRECDDLAGLLQRVMLRIENVLGMVQYNYFIHSGPAYPASAQYQASFHWHLELCPRTSIPNGFELGSGLAINTVSPEMAVERLRTVL